MAVVIRLRKEGKRNRPYFRVVVTDKESPRDGRFLELVGTYNPMGKDEGMKLKLDRIDHWVGRGAKPSVTVASFIRKARRAPKA
jgi:small subunit ribosomal protein S16